MRGQKYQRTMKKWVIKIENQLEFWYKTIKNCQITDFVEKIRPNLSPIIFGTKWDRDKLIFFSAERGGQLDRDES